VSEVSSTEIYAVVPWEMVTGPFGSAECTLGITDQVQCK